MKNHTWMNWELADAGERKSVVQDVVNTIRMVAYPYFEQFESLDNLFDTLLNDDIPSFAIDNAIDLVSCYKGIEAARDVGRNFLKRRPDLISDYEKKLPLYQDKEAKCHATAYADVLAFYSSALELGKLSP